VRADLTPGVDAQADDAFASNQTECEHIVDAVTSLTAGVRPTAGRQLSWRDRVGGVGD